MSFLTSAARGIATIAGRAITNKYTVTALAGALAITAGPVFVERSIRGLGAAGDAHKFAKTTYEDYKKLGLRDQSSYKPIR